MKIKQPFKNSQNIAILQLMLEERSPSYISKKVYLSLSAIGYRVRLMKQHIGCITNARLLVEAYKLKIINI